MDLAITAERPDTPDARALIAALDVELADYPDESRHGYSVERLLERGVEFHVLRVDGRPVGCAGLEPAEGYAEVKRMYVAPELRGAGLADALLDQLERRARELGLPLLRLETGIKQHAAIRLYARHGFGPIGPFGPYREDPLSVYLEKAVGGPPRRSPSAAFYEPWTDPTRDHAATPPPTSHTGAAGEVESVVLGGSRLADRLQSRLGPVAFGYAVFKKYADDEGSRLAALLAYYGFLSLFPLAIAGLAVLNKVLAGRPELVDRIVEEIVPPDYQQQVIDAYQALPDSGVALAVALVGLLLSGTAGVFSFYAMTNQVFAVPYRFRYGFGPRYARVLVMVLLLGIGVLVVAVGSGLLATVSGYAGVQRASGFVLVWLVAFLLLYSAVVVLSRRPLTFGEVGLGAGLGGLAMTVVFALGGLMVSRFVASSSAVYGAFATVVGIISVLFVASNAVVFSFEISVVRAWRLWPRGLDINLLFNADERALALLAIMDERMPSQRNGVAFDATGHDDPRRPEQASLTTRPAGVPRRPYDLG